MEISVHLRGGGNLTDARSTAIAKGLSYLPHTIRIRSRGEVPTGADLVIQTGFNSTTAITSAIESRIPYMIMEATSFRDFYDKLDASTFTYNGLQAGGTRPNVPSEVRPHPELLEMHTDGPTMIIGQKTNDHSLRGTDHVEWVLEKFREYPDATLRHNPIMVPKGSLGHIADALADYGRTVSYTSTASVDSVFAGCKTICEHPANEAYGMNFSPDREEWAHKISWHNFKHEELEDDDIAAWILTGYDEARANAEAGKVEIPRKKMDGKALFERYYQTFT